jgi:hypothetical protein
MKLNVGFGEKIIPVEKYLINSLGAQFSIYTPNIDIFTEFISLLRTN